MLKPGHFLGFFFDVAADFSPPKKTPRRPSAVPMAKTPEGEKAVDRTKGGEKEMPFSGAARVESSGKPDQYGVDESERAYAPIWIPEMNSSLMKSRCLTKWSYPAETSSFPLSEIN